MTKAEPQKGQKGHIVLGPFWSHFEQIFHASEATPGTVLPAYRADAGVGVVTPLSGGAGAAHETVIAREKEKRSGSWTSSRDFTRRLNR